MFSTQEINIIIIKGIWCPVICKRLPTEPHIELKNLANNNKNKTLLPSTKDSPESCKKKSGNKKNIKIICKVHQNIIFVDFLTTFFNPV